MNHVSRAHGFLRFEILAFFSSSSNGMWANFGGSSTRESSTVEKLGLEYYLSREMALVASYQHTAFDTNSTTGGAYSDNTVRVGLRVRR